MPTAAALAARLLLAAFLLVAGVGHLVNTEEFLGQTPTFLPWRDGIVVVSGLVEIGLAVGLVALRGDGWPGGAGWSRSSSWPSSPGTCGSS